ncbi:MAG: type II toxin-antitoxin system HicB family antitoxin [Anaerolineae bacterium]|nr:type II toxin-antitoxin system HicB family antitoxin [Anaerolineae bacterium]
MAKYLVYIETAGDPITGEGPTAHVPALPGASARGNTIEEAKGKIQEAVEAYVSLLRDVGEPVPKASEGIQLQFEEVEKTTFPTDYDALHPNELETLFRWMAISRQELVDLVKDLPEETLDWKRNDDSPCIRKILCHIAEGDLWYSDRLKRWPETPLFRLAATRGVALERLRALKEADWNKFTIYDGKKWTPRKVIRRILEHEREQIQQIRGMLAEKPSS